MVSAMTTPNPPPEAQLLERARKLTAPKLTVADAARRAGISEARWRQITRGARNVAGGGLKPETASDELLYRMALAVGVTSDELREAGRPGAASYLDTKTSQAPRTPLQTYPEEELLNELLRRAHQRADHEPLPTIPSKDDFGRAARKVGRRPRDETDD